ncbi:MAG: MATE family efflux transporter [Clostridia bacterium]|nr:MATE family efflux transporter [Clostridia bacterium]
MKKVKDSFRSALPYYKRMLTIAVPIMIQSGITNFVSMIDNVMVGRVGTLQMTGVSIVNQIIMVFNLCIFGAMSGAGIFTAQYYGKKDNDGIRNTVQYKIITALIISAFGIGAFVSMGDFLINAYLQGEGSPEDISLVSEYARGYLQIMLLGIVPFALSNAYSSSLRETSDRIIPMIATISAVFTNFILNYCLIFGNFGFPRLGIKGAAIATVISRFVELFILMLWSHTHTKKYPFIKKLYLKTTMTREEIRKITLITLPLIINETLWAGGMAFLNQCYSIRGLDVVAAINIVSTLSNVFNVVFISSGSAIGIIMSQLLGAKKVKEAKENSMRLIWFSVFLAFIIGVVMALFSPFFPKIYNTTDSVRTLATELLFILSIFMMVHAFTNGSYFTLRSGGKTVMTFIFDSGFVWLCSVPVAFILSRFTGVSIIYLYITVQALDLLKCVLGYIFVKKGVWLNTVV